MGRRAVLRRARGGPSGCRRRAFPIASEKPPEAPTCVEVCLCDRRRDLLAREGDHRSEHRSDPQGAGSLRLHPQARSIHQRGPGHDEPVPAWRGLRHRRRRGDRPRPRPLRAVHRREPDPALERDHGPHLPGSDREGAPGRLPRRHCPGHPAHYERDQGADHSCRPPGRSGRGHRRGRRDRRRHREPALPRGDPPDAQGRRARERAVRARHAAARPRGDRRAQDQAHAALGQGAARDRHPAGRHRPSLGSPRLG